ncbi:MAG: methyl-accepting chemotaxis protein [Treponema sp.]
MQEEKKCFSIRKKLLIIFGALLTITAIIQGILSQYTAQQILTKRVHAHLTDKVTDIALLINSEIRTDFELLSGLMYMPEINDQSISYTDKTRAVQTKIDHTDGLTLFNMCDMNGNCYYADGKVISVKDTNWFQQASQGKPFITEPQISPVTNKLEVIFAVPLLATGGKIIGILAAGLSGTTLCETVSEIIIGQTGNCYILGLDGVTIADKNTNIVAAQNNAITMAKTDKSLQSIADFQKRALSANSTGIGYYTYQGNRKIAAYAKMKNTNWTVIITAPVEEFMGEISKLRNSSFTIGLIMLGITLIITFLIAKKTIVPLQTAVNALKDISQGEGDLTVQLPLIGNDEVTQLSNYFNKTIEKIRLSIQSIDKNTNSMQLIGDELAQNMTDTAQAVHKITENIDGVMNQALTQTSSVAQTAETVENIIKIIKQLNTSIESQASSVSVSSSAIEEMVANIASITNTLEQTDGVIKTLANATADGRDIIVNTSSVAQKIAEESGSLLEASSVIQHIASQTNLLAMNAAIEAAHAGEAGKGFAVVADEIRKLAEESSGQGKAITTTLKALSGEIETLSTSSKIAGEKFNVIFTLSDQVKNMSTRLTEAMREQENGSREVLGAIRTISEVTTEVEQGSDDMLKGGEGVATEMQNLDNLTNIIASSMKEMSSAVTQINNAMQRVKEITQKNKYNIKNLAKEVSKFKT